MRLALSGGMRPGMLILLVVAACGFDRSGVAGEDPVDEGTAADAAPAPDPDGGSAVIPPDALACGVDPVSPGSCPSECTGGCQAGVCTIDCTGDQECRDDTLACPAGFACAVTCDGQDACRGATVVCPPEHGCDVECVGSSACRDTAVECGAGACTSSCGGSGDLFGGGVAAPDLQCGASCACMPC